MTKNKCKLYVINRRDGIEIAVDQNNTVFLRTYGRGYKGDCWGAWHILDFNPRVWEKLDHTRINPCEDKEAWPIKQDVLDGLELLIDTTK